MAEITEGYTAGVDAARRAAAHEEAQRGDDGLAQQFINIAARQTKNDPRADKYHTGGVVPKDATYNLKRGEQVLAAPSNTPNAAPSDPGKINLKKSFAKVQESLAALADGLGVKRAFAVPFVSGESAADHIKSVGNAAATAGGLGHVLLTSGHKSGGKGYGSGDGETVGHHAQKLRETLIPKDWPEAQAAISAAQRFISQVGSLLGEKDQSVQVAQSQLDLVKKTSGAGMSAFDFFVLIQQCLFAPTQAIARAHSGTKPGGHSPALRAPHNPPTDDNAPAAAAPDAAAPSQVPQS
jgi:hypothetical protein